MIITEKIKDKLNTRFIGKRIFFHEQLDSTNIEAFRLINSNEASHGDVIIAKTQTCGKGQQEHQWNSPEGGIYMSIITSSKVCEANNLITFASGIACVEAIKELTGISPHLKWVNDILVNKNKLGGILTETITRGNISTQVTGIGVNTNAKINNISNLFSPVSLSEIIGKNIDINALISLICKHFEYFFDIYQKDSNFIREKWSENSNIIGLSANFLLDNEVKSGIIQGIDVLGHLKIKHSDKIYTLTSSQNVEIFYK